MQKKIEEIQSYLETFKITLKAKRQSLCHPAYAGDTNTQTKTTAAVFNSQAVNKIKPCQT